MKEKLTVEMIKKAVKILEKYKAIPDENGEITIEVENPSELYDFLKGVKNKPPCLNIKEKMYIKGII